MIVFENEIFKVSNGWLRGWRVILKPTGLTIDPDQDLKIRIGLLWPKVKYSKELQDRQEVRLAENMMFFMFGTAAVDPSSDVALRFCHDPIEDVRQVIIRETIVQITAARMSAGRRF